MEVVYDQKKITTSQFNYCFLSFLCCSFYQRVSFASDTLMSDCTREKNSPGSVSTLLGVDLSKNAELMLQKPWWCSAVAARDVFRKLQFNDRTQPLKFDPFRSWTCVAINQAWCTILHDLDQVER